MIQFKKLIIHQFGSIVDRTEIVFHDKGLTRITGKNGAGKTTLLSALSWCLYGITLKKKSTVEPWPGLSNKDGAYVEVWLSVNDLPYCIERCYNTKTKASDLIKGGNRVIITDQEGVMTDVKGKIEQNKVIVNTLGMSFEVFKNTVLFGQQMERFMREDGPSKKKILEEIFDISYINKAKEKCDKEIIGINQALNKITPNLHNIQLELVKLRTEQSTNKKYLAEFKNNKASRMSRLLKLKEIEEAKLKNIKVKKFIDYDYRIKLTKKKLSKYEAKLSELNDYNNKLFQKELESDTVKAELEKLDREYLVIKAMRVTDTCPVCSNKLSDKHINKLRKDKADKLQELKNKRHASRQKWVRLVDEVHKLGSKIYEYNKYKGNDKKLRDKINSLYQKSQEQDKIKNQISLLKSKLEGVLRDIKELKGEKPPNFKDYEQEIKTNEKKESVIKAEIEGFENELKQYQWLVKEPLSNKGLKMYIFNQMIGLINLALMKYESLLPFDIMFEVNNDSANKDFIIKLIKGKLTIPYDDLSGGQKQLVDICIAFSINDVFSLDNPVNIIAFDEVFENLDSDNVQIIKETIIGKSRDKHILLISHQDNLSITHCEELKFKLDKKGRSILV